jgi:Mg-chelatase subunit ChlD
MADVSCSNGKTRLAAAKTAVNTFINNIPSDADVGLMMFDQNGTKERVELGFGERSDIIRQVSASRPGGGTPLSSAVRTGYHALAAKAVQQLGYGEYNLVIVTDGEASGGQNPRKDVNALLAKSPITIHTIGFCIKGNHSLNQQGLTIYKSAKDPNSLSQGLSEVLAESPDFNVGSFQEG